MNRAISINTSIYSTDAYGCVRKDVLLHVEPVFVNGSRARLEEKIYILRMQRRLQRCLRKRIGFQIRTIILFKNGTLRRDSAG
jgi:hypothetical protein